MSTTQRDRARAFLKDGEAGTFRAEKDSGNSSTAKVYLYAPIDDWFGVSAEQFTQALADLDVDTIELHVNSPGGIAFDGITMMNALRQHDAKVVAYVDGLAASAASIVILGADEIVMSPGSELMVHEASGLCWGTAGDMAKVQTALDKLSGNLASLYAARAGGTDTEWRDVMLAETWYTAGEAVTAGLADRVDDDSKDAGDAPAQASWDLSMFAHAGRRDAPAPQTPAAALAAAAATRGPSGSGSIPPVAPGGTTEGTTTVSTFTDAQMDALRQKLGVTDAEADGDTLLAALDETLQEQTTDPDPKPAAAAVPEGMELVDTGALAQMRQDAAAGREARDEQIAAHRTAAVDAAVADGRIPPARRDHWLAQLQADPGAEEVLGSLSKGLVNTVETGHAGGVDLDDDTQLAKSIGWESDDDTAKGA